MKQLLWIHMKSETKSAGIIWIVTLELYIILAIKYGKQRWFLFILLKPFTHTDMLKTNRYDSAPFVRFGINKHV